MDLREEFVLRAKAPGACIAALCREYAVSRKTGYKWLARFDAEGGGVGGHVATPSPRRGNIGGGGAPDPRAPRCPSALGPQEAPRPIGSAPSERGSPEREDYCPHSGSTRCRSDQTATSAPCHR
jgi:transposase-like protein